MTNVRRSIRSVRSRAWISGVLVALLTLGLVEIWLVEGLLIPCRVAGGSMAPTLLGVHRQVTCDDCGFIFPCEADGAVHAVCPNCGYAANRLADRPKLAGDRVLIDRTAFWRRPPRRWELVALRDPTQSDRQAVKRIVGLPGETITLRHGDVYADGRLLRKNLAEQRALAQLVYDADFPSRSKTLPPRWRSVQPDTRWQRRGALFFFTGQSDDRLRDKPVDWLVYHHGRRLPGDRVQSSAVLDLGGYDPARPRREEDVHATSDLMLSLELGPVSGRGAFWIRAADGRDRFLVRLNYESDGLHGWQVFNDTAATNVTQTGDWLDAKNKKSHRVDVSLIDRQFLLAIDGRTLAVRHDLPDRPPKAVTSDPFAMAAEGIDATVGRLCVYRDVYYLAAESPSVQLPAHHYDVLGDNSPESLDSRTWGANAAVDANLLIGNILAAIPNVPIGPIAGRYFQVPNPLRIRYIHGKGTRD